jgi:hypothetical protein
MKEINFSTRRMLWPRERAIGGGGIFIELSQETSRWSQFLNSRQCLVQLDNVQWEWTLSA